mgnify:CR=1 FL=1
MTGNGALVAWCDNSRMIAGTEPFQVFGWAPGVWRGFFAASVVDGGAVAVEHWDDLDARLLAAAQRYPAGTWEIH